MQFRIGCSGWSYSSWTGAFYPPNLENSCWLRFYSQIFDYVEIDSTFYRIPNEFMVKNWAKGTPNNFKFTAKFPKVITHDKQLVEVEDDIDLFLKIWNHYTKRPFSTRSVTSIAENNARARRSKKSPTIFG